MALLTNRCKFFALKSVWKLFILPRSGGAAFEATRRSPTSGHSMTLPVRRV